MDHSSDLGPVLEFLKGLQRNNNKAWFEQHRAAYEDARSRFEAFVSEIIDGLTKVEDMSGVTAKDCVMRIYRDVRFSRDKSPYKIAMGASIGPGGRHSQFLKYFLHIQPHDESMIAGGLHMPEPAQINAFRAAVAHDARPFRTVINEAAFKRVFGSVEGERLKTFPQGYDRDHPEIELLRLKEVVAIHHYPDEDVATPKFRQQIVQACKAMKPFLDYLNSLPQVNR